MPAAAPDARADAAASTKPTAVAIPAALPSNNPPAPSSGPPATPPAVPSANVPASGDAATSLATGTTWHDGLALRLSAGLGYWYTNFGHEPPMAAGAATASSFSATATTLGAAIESSVSSDLSVFGEVLASLASNPTAKNPWGYENTWDGTYGLVSIGPGVAYDFDRLNLYASGTLTVTRLFGKATDGRQGLGANAAIGKEWWASAHWGIGLVAALQFALADDELRGITTSLVPSLRLSSTWH